MLRLMVPGDQYYHVLPCYQNRAPGRTNQNPGRHANLPIVNGEHVVILATSRLALDTECYKGAILVLNY